MLAEAISVLHSGVKILSRSTGDQTVTSEKDKKKMASQRQLEANRANAKRSTGPKSERGKARSGRNAVTHGLTAKQIVLSGEEPEQFDRLRQGLNADFAPGSTIERELVETLAASLWRRRRAPVVEAAVLNRLIGGGFTLSKILPDLTTEELELLEKICARALGLEKPTLSDLPDQQHEDGRLPKRVEMLTILSRHDTRLMNDIIKTINLIHVLQARRIAAEEGARTVNATPSKGRLPAVQACSPSSRSPHQKMVGSNERSHPNSRPDSLVANSVGVTRER